jgi:hypothetical protein
MFSIKNHGKSGKKTKGTRSEVYADKERMRRIYTIATFLIIISLIILVSYYAATHFGGLYSTHPNDEFTRVLTERLEEADFQVDVFQGTEVTVNFLKSMPNGYQLIILRMHSALHEDQLYLFTAEPYSIGKYTQEQQFQLVKEAYVTEETQHIFAVNWGFIKRCMTGKFNGTLVIAMGCDGTRDPTIIEEFMNQGAVGYISWNGPVLLSHSDTATLHLTAALYSEKLPVEEAIERTNNQVGADPEHGAVLEYYTP